MATFAELIERTDILVQDPSLTDMLGDFINQGVAEIAGGMQSVLGSWLTPPLPLLFTIDTVVTSTSAAYVDMPEEFHRGLQMVVDSSGREISIEHSFIEFTETYPLLNKTGNISAAVEHGNKLYYQGIPVNSETLTLHFYRKPVNMVLDADTPDGIPEHLQILLLTNYAAWKAYEFIEIDLLENSSSIPKFMGAFLTALKTLELSIPDYTRSLFLK